MFYSLKPIDPSAIEVDLIILAQAMIKMTKIITRPHMNGATESRETQT